MIARIENLSDKKLIGMHLTMSLVDNKTASLWKRFMPRLNEIEHRLSNDLISMQIYKPIPISDFSPTNDFEKWAAVEVDDLYSVPSDMETFFLSSGLYAVFDYKGLSNDHGVFEYIFGTWLPNSNYLLDHRPHFEILGGKYKNDDPNSEEEIWIPIRHK